MSANGHLLNAVNVGDESSRLLLNAHMYEMGLARYVISKKKWNAWRPHPNLIEAIRGFARRKNDRED